MAQSPDTQMVAVESSSSTGSKLSWPVLSQLVVYEGPIEIRRIPGKGYGMFTTRDIQPGKNQSHTLSNSSHICRHTAKMKGRRRRGGLLGLRYVIICMMWVGCLVYFIR